jgi:hypothetical protein
MGPDSEIPTHLPCRNPRNEPKEEGNNIEAGRYQAITYMRSFFAVLNGQHIPGLAVAILEKQCPRSVVSDSC